MGVLKLHTIKGAEIMLLFYGLYVSIGVLFRTKKYNYITI